MNVFEPLERHRTQPKCVDTSNWIHGCSHFMNILIIIVILKTVATDLWTMCQTLCWRYDVQEVSQLILSATLWDKLPFLIYCLGYWGFKRLNNLLRSHKYNRQNLESHPGLSEVKALTSQSHTSGSQSLVWGPWEFLGPFQGIYEHEVLPFFTCLYTRGQILCLHFSQNNTAAD